MKNWRVIAERQALIIENIDEEEKHLADLEAR